MEEAISQARLKCFFLQLNRVHHIQMFHLQIVFSNACRTLERKGGLPNVSRRFSCSLFSLQSYAIDCTTYLRSVNTYHMVLKYAKYDHPKIISWFQHFRRFHFSFFLRNYGRWRIHFFFFFPIFLFEMRSHHRVSSCSDVNTVGSRRKRRMLVNSFFEDTCLQRMKEKMLWLLSPSIIIIDAIEIVSIEQFVKKALIFSPPCSFLSVFRVPINLFRSKIRWTRLLWVILLFVQRNIKTISRIRC